MRHQILYNRKQNKQKFDLLAHLKSKGKRPVVITEDDSPWVKSVAKRLGYKTKDLPPQPQRPPFADNREGLGASLLSDDPLNLTIALAARRAKAKNYNNGGTK